MLGKGEKIVQVCDGKAQRIDHSEDRGADGRMGLERSLGDGLGRSMWSGFTSAKSSVVGFREHGDEPLGSGATESVSLLHTEELVCVLKLKRRYNV
jgi:hypothetical protein